MAERTSLLQRRPWMGKMLCTLSIAMALMGRQDYERELLRATLHRYINTGRGNA